MFTCRPSLWMSTYQFMFWFSYGVYLPFRGLWLEKLGISDADVGMLVGFGLAARCVINFTLTPFFHKVGHLIPFLRWSMFLSLLGFIAFIWLGTITPSFWTLALLLVIFNLAIGPAVAISDAISNHYARDNRLDYGYTRLWGAVALTVASACMGWVIQHFGVSAVPVMGAVGLGATFIGTLMNPSVSMVCHHNEEEKKPNIFKVLCCKETLVFLLVASLLEGSHGGYYFFSTVYWAEKGLDSDTIGYLWSLSTISVIVFYLVSRKAFSSWKVSTLFKLAAVAVVLRWGLMAVSTDLPVLIFCQILHGITFSGTILSSVRYVEENRKHNYVALQSLYHAIPAGFVLAIVSAACGWLMHHSDINMFWFMAVMGIPCIFLTVKQPEPCGSKASVLQTKTLVSA
ncbi:3-phenylpropionate MFS transporter [Photobacterium leiognathi subsp. mandapamensis]|uniref:3-phenylpropionate MFS transporter n=1 Tax=Photobacterium leiognathi TaxID=553611 RepID=UPI000D16A985|nr:3-phenylpropionate MFS transporter [Photobacterium leiognathi]PSU94595.1 3-phenylpropionate MFS transporter [Photobacterium leiognathi subsp. mandapamensis]